MQAESQREHGISTPTTPSFPNSNNISENVKAEVIEQNNKKLEEQVQENREVSQLIKRYGKTSRIHLTDAELIEFNNFLKKK